MDVVPGQLIATLQDPRDIPGRGNCIIESHLHFSLTTYPDSAWSHRDPGKRWLNGELTRYQPGMEAPRDKLVSPIPCESK